MAIVNRDLDPTQQRMVYTAPLTNTITGQTYPLLVVPSPSSLVAMQQCVTGLSGAPNHSVWLQRFVAGAGVTSIVFGASMASVAFATSGGQSFTLAAGVTFQLQAGDLLMLSTAAANTASTSTVVTLVLRQLQDIVSDFGV